VLELEHPLQAFRIKAVEKRRALTRARRNEKGEGEVSNVLWNFI
jgi:hypothetical protein